MFSTVANTIFKTSQNKDIFFKRLIFRFVIITISLVFITVSLNCEFDPYDVGIPPDISW